MIFPYVDLTPTDDREHKHVGIADTFLVLTEEQLTLLKWLEKEKFLNTNYFEIREREELKKC